MANIPSRILRRNTGAAGAPSTLLNAQLAHNEVDDTIYIGKGLAGNGVTSTSVVAVAGKGAFVDKASEQTITGKKNFTSATVSTAPSASTDAVRKTDLDTEVAALQGAISTEVTARTNADTTLDGKITTEKSRIDAILSASSADKDSFAEIVSLINSVDTTNDQAFAGYVLSNDAALAAEVTARTNADSGLNTRLTTAEGKITTLQNTAAGLGTMSTQNANNVAITGGTVSGVTFTNATFTDLVIDSGTF
jgi:hypothetical protein